MKDDVPRIDFILGRCDDMRAEVYLRATGLPADAETRIAATLRGPESRHAVTLPATATFFDMPPGSAGTAAVARAILTEPSYWTPELPGRYRLRAALTAGGTTLVECDQLVGLRRLGVRGRSFWLEGRRWVPRGLTCSAASIDMSTLREQLAVAVVADPPETLCSMADEVGVGIVARCGADPVACCERWRVHPSVMLAVMPRGLAEPALAVMIERIAASKGTMLVGIEVDATQPPPSLPKGIDFLVVTMPTETLPHPAWRDCPPLPLIGSRAAAVSLTEQRQACDRLQADLAAWRNERGASWDWAGYLVQWPHDGIGAEK